MDKSVVLSKSSDVGNVVDDWIDTDYVLYSSGCTQIKNGSLLYFAVVYSGWMNLQSYFDRRQTKSNQTVDNTHVPFTPCFMSLRHW